MSDAYGTSISVLCKQLAKVSKERTDAQARVDELEKRNGNLGKAVAYATQKFTYQEARINELEAALEEIGHMGFDMPATLDLTDEAWSQRRAGMMQHIAREALKDTTNE